MSASRILGAGASIDGCLILRSAVHKVVVRELGAGNPCLFEFGVGDECPLCFRLADVRDLFPAYNWIQRGTHRSRTEESFAFGAISRRWRRGEFGRLQPWKLVCLCGPFLLMENQQIIDAHVMLGEEHPLALQPDDLLRRMDSHGIDRAIARPMGAELVVGNQAGNNRVLKCGPRICGLVSVNPWYGPRAIDELKRCQQAGAVGLFLHPSRQGFMPTEPIVAPVLAFAAEAQWPVMFHTGSYVYSDVLAVAEVARALSANAIHLGLRRLCRYVVRNSWRDGRRAQSLVGNVAHVGRRHSRHTQSRWPAANHFWQRRAEQLLCISAQVPGESRFRRRHEDCRLTRERPSAVPIDVRSICGSSISTRISTRTGLISQCHQRPNSFAAWIASRSKPHASSLSKASMATAANTTTRLLPARGDIPID